MIKNSVHVFHVSGIRINLKVVSKYFCSFDEGMNGFFAETGPFFKSTHENHPIRYGDESRNRRMMLNNLINLSLPNPLTLGTTYICISTFHLNPFLDHSGSMKNSSKEKPNNLETTLDLING